MDLDEYETRDISSDREIKWHKYRRASEDKDGTHGSRKEEIIKGWHGYYDLAQGYFDCFNLEDYPTRKDFVEHIDELENFID